MDIWYTSNRAGSPERELSNLAYRPFIDLEGRKYVSVEHAYQTWKSGRFDANTYAKPWKAGSKYIGKPANKASNIKTMERLMRASFEQNPTALEMLLGTGGTQLTHLKDAGVWREEFPRILMQLREELR